MTLTIGFHISLNINRLIKRIWVFYKFPEAQVYTQQGTEHVKQTTNVCHLLVQQTADQGMWYEVVFINTDS